MSDAAELKRAFANVCREYDKRGDRIEELSNCVAVLEAKLSKSEALFAKAVEMAYDKCPFGYGTEGYYEWWYNRHKLLAELKGETDE
jgi:hypothetical protein